MVKNLNEVRVVPKKENENEQAAAAKNVLKNLDNLQQETKKSAKLKDKEDSTIYEPPAEHQPTLFMLNNNSPQPNSYEPYMKDVEAYYKQNVHTRSYGTSAIVLAVIAAICSIVLIIAVASGFDSSQVSGFFLWVFNFILIPVVGIAGSVLLGLIAAILGIVAICKAHKRLISWVGFGISLVVLAYVVILAGVYLFT